MQLYEYTVIPAPARGEKVRGARTPAERFSYALLTEMNRMAAQGWEYVRAETLPSEERSGLTSRTTVYHNVLVFRRALAPAQPQHRPLAAERAPEPAAVPARAEPALRSPAAAPAAAPPSDWPDGGAEEDEMAGATHIDDYDEPGFDPEPAPAESPRPAAAPQTDPGPAHPAAPPAFTRRPPLAAAREEGERVFSGSMPGGARLGPAER